VILIHSDRFAEHQTPPGHPERPERAEVMDAVAARWREQGIEIVAPREATPEQLARVHDRDYLRRISETRGKASQLDPDTYTAPESHEVALLAAGAAVDAVDRVMGGAHTAAVALVRPPGHHAERGRAMGFCFYNNIAVAAAHARAQGAAKVAIVDYDVHHGNGTQWSFYSDPSVLFISSHQYPYYPGTGAAGDVGSGAGAGFTVNLPLSAGATDADYELVYTRIALPILKQFRPELILISAGFDAHHINTWNQGAGGKRARGICCGHRCLICRFIADADLRATHDCARGIGDRSLNASGRNGGLCEGDDRQQQHKKQRQCELKGSFNSG